jgi:hypothetical protein
MNDESEGQIRAFWTDVERTRAARRMNMLMSNSRRRVEYNIPFLSFVLSYCWTVKAN